MAKNDKITITEMATMLKSHPCFTDPNHDYYSTDPDDIPTPEKVHALWKRLKLRGVTVEEFRKAIASFMSRENAYGPLWLIETYGFNDRGQCVMGRGVRKQINKKDWHMAEPYRTPIEHRRKYYAEKPYIMAVNEQLQYINPREL